MTDSTPHPLMVRSEETMRILKGIIFPCRLNVIKGKKRTVAMSIV